MSNNCICLVILNYNKGWRNVLYIVFFGGSTIHTKNEIIFSKEKVPLNPQEQPLVSLKCPISTFAEIWGLFCVEKNVIFALINKNIIWKMQS